VVAGTSRMTALHAGIPFTVASGPGGIPSSYSDEVPAHPFAELLHMGITSENVAAEFGVPRGAQGAFAVRSFQNPVATQKLEISRVKSSLPEQGDRDASETKQKVLVDADDGIRDGVTAETLVKLFTKDGCTHAGKCPCFADILLLNLLLGNASQVSDGAATILLAHRSVVSCLGLPILGKCVAPAVLGVPPRVMGVGPVYAIDRLLGDQRGTRQSGFVQRRDVGIGSG
jgi:acetyl-CoA acyltransferase 1